jgi:HEAT repeats
LDDETLLRQVKKGEGVPEQELALIRERLAARVTSQDKYTLLHILWKSHDLKAKDVFVLHLGDGDEMVRRIAVQAFTELWPSEEAFQIARRMLRDPSKHVRMAAASSIGELGAVLRQRTADAAVLLLELFDSLQSEGGPEWESYYDGLLNIANVPYSKRPLATRPLSRSDVDEDVIRHARALAATTVNPQN